MRTPRYDYHIYYPTPRATPICHFFFDDFVPVEEVEGKWAKKKLKAHVVRVVDTTTGYILYEKGEA